MLDKGIVVVLSGPSGSGKDTVIKNILKKSDKIVPSVSATTRKPRPDEVNGKDYYFLSDEEFENRIKDGKMLEYVVYCNNYYGTPYKPLAEKTKCGFDVILNIEVLGSRLVRENLEDAVHIFLLPPSLKELKERLAKRGTESEKVRDERLKIAKKEISYFKNYDYIVINENINTCTDQVFSIIISEKLRVSRIKNRNETIMKEIF